MKNRYLPFGYQIVQGEIVVNTTEAEAIRTIYNLYAAGLGYTEITKRMNDSDISYHPDAPWNKHMVKRILENEKYIGANGYPPILDDDLFQTVFERKAMIPKQNKPREQPKAIIPDMPTPKYEPTAAIRKLEKELNRTIERKQPSEAKSLILQCGAAKYISLEGGTAPCVP